MSKQIIRVAIFYDGGFFWHVNNYYHYIHARKSPISITGVHQFVRNQIAEEEGVDYDMVRILDSHYYRGRQPAIEAQNKNRLYADRVFEDVLMREGVVTHFMPVTSKGEKGVDMWLALDCFEMTRNKHYDVVVIIASDSDYVPLVKKLNSLGSRVMCLGWDFEFIDNYGNKQVTITSANLMEHATYPILMHSVMEGDTQLDEEAIANLFIPAREQAQEDKDSNMTPFGPKVVLSDRIHNSLIAQLYSGYGFIATETPGKNLFFHYSELENCDFADLMVGDKVEYKLGRNDKGEFAVEVKKMVD